ncbi:hypothetical protein RHMOL_Rhmol04G0323300 [Rhododendron molle]|uniref:Uncharacterized protein n=1 Tax=Rhododendron molle TaxID=49168 RepID=A0ACC0P8B1_RHOML|nr:hypothetical protein RHMOL_Rhmol04G0323300 [Rhododendron molle]
MVLESRREDMVSPRKRMNLGKKVAQSGSHRLGVLPLGAYSAGRVNWDSQMTWLFLQLAIKEIEAEGRGMTQLSNNSMRNIAAELSARTGGVITLKQWKNRYGVSKRDWQAWILLADSRRGATGLGWNPVTGPSDNGLRVQQFVEEYNSLPHLYANSDFRLSHNSTGHATEAQAGYDNWEWMNNNNGNAGSSTNAFADDTDSVYSIPADEFYAEIEEKE